MKKNNEVIADLNDPKTLLRRRTDIVFESDGKGYRYSTYKFHKPSLSIRYDQMFSRFSDWGSSANWKFGIMIAIGILLSPIVLVVSWFVAIALSIKKA